MRSDQMFRVSIAAVAGLACSTAMAQKQARHPLPATVEVSAAGAAETGIAEPTRIESIMPIAIVQNGITYPVRTTSTDALTTVFSNGLVTQTAYFTSGTRPKRLLDRASLVPGPGQGAPQLLASVRTAIFTLNPVTVGSESRNVEMEVEVFNDWNPAAAAGAPVNTTSLGGVRLVFAPPVATGVWANNTVYIMTAPVAIPTPIQLSDADFSVDYRCYDPGGAGNTGLSTVAGPVMRDGGANLFNPPDVGYSDGLYYRDASADGIYGSTGERFFFAGRLANAVVGFEAELATTGACCLPDGTCQQLSSGFCTARSGIFTAGACGTCTQPGTVVFNNAFTGSPPPPAVGTLSTGPTSSQGPAPAGYNWSEMQLENASCANNLFGTSANSAGPFRLSDDFTLTSQTTISQLLIFPYLGTTGEHYVAPFTSATVRIWNGPPDNASSTVVFGDTTTNRLASQMFVGLYRIGPTNNTSLATPQQPVQTETLIYRAALNVNTSLPAGTYWVDWDITFTAGSNSFFPPATVPGARTVAGWNAKQLATGVWGPVTDGGNPAGCGAGTVPQDLAFVLLGTGSTPCYANCDGSTGNPALNANDFQCFLNAYAIASTLPNNQQITNYANCDQSTGNPALNANDFQCFLNAFAIGCS